MNGQPRTPGDLASARAALSRGDRETAERDALAVTQRTPSDAEAWRLAASLALERGEVQGAMLRLTKALAADSNNDDAWADLGRLYLGIGRPEQTREAMQRALTLRPDRAAHWHTIALALLTESRPEDAVAALREGLRQADALPQHHLALAAALLESGAAEDALTQARLAAAALPHDPQAAFVTGSALAALRRHAEAAEAFAEAAATSSTPAQAHYNRALALDEAGDLKEALVACDQALVAEPELWPALAQRVFTQRRLADWTGLDQRSRRLIEAVRADAPGITPFSFLAEPATPADQLRCARTHARTLASAVAGTSTAAAAPRSITRGGPRVGFVSSGFNNHPTALLIAELVERLAASPLRAIGYATTADDGGALRRRLRAGFAEFQDAAALDPGALAERIRSDAIDVLVDLRGYGAGSAAATFARRPAPVAVNWLAYPGTSGARFIDYLLADAQVVPTTQRMHYSEAVVRLPHSFQPSDTTRQVGQPPARKALGLPEQGLVFASFNNSYKIGPQVFAAWMRILAGVPDSTLWLLGEPDSEFARHLRRAAASAGIAVTRLVFQPKIAHDRYLALYRHVDLFLDTWPYGAHTTASDAAWAGAPMLTLAGESFASRVGSSLLHCLGLPTLIADSVDDYVGRAIRLATQPGLLGSLRQRLEVARAASPLFDMPRFARDFARAIQYMHDRQRAGLPPADHDLAA